MAILMNFLKTQTYNIYINMIQQAQQINQLKEQIVKTSSVNYVIPIPQTNQKQIAKQIIASHARIRQIQEKQINILQPPNNSIDIKLKNILASIRAYQPSGLINQQNFSTQDYRKLSLYPLLSQIVTKRLIKLVQIQTQIDPINKRLVTIPGSSKPIITAVNQIFSQNSMIKQFDKMLGIYSTINDIKQQVQRQMIRPLLQQALKSIGRTNFYIGKAKMLSALFNVHVKAPVYQEQIITLQQRAIQQIRKQNQKMNPNDEIFNSVRRLIFGLIKRKRIDHMERNNFFSIIKADQIIDYEHMISSSITKQIQTLAKLDKIK